MAEIKDSKGLPADLSAKANEETETALDQLLKDTETPPVVTPPATPPAKPAEVPAAAPATPPAPPAAPAAPAAVVPPKPLGAADLVPVAAPPVVVPPAAPTAPEKDILDSVELSPMVRPKTTESFTKLKELARGEITKVRTEAENLRKQVEELSKKTVAKPLTPETEKELEELRNFRRALDVESDPEFKKQFDTATEQNVEAIYRKLKEVGMSDDNVEKIKKLGGFEKINQEDLLSKLDPGSRRYIEAKLIENAGLADKRQAAVAQAKQKQSEYFQKKESDKAAQTEADLTTIVNTVNQYLAPHAWTRVKEIPATATAEQRAQLEKENTFAAETLDRIKTFVLDTTPKGRAAVAWCAASGFRYKADAESWQKRAETAEAELTKIKNASVLTPPNVAPSATPPALPSKTAAGDDLKLNVHPGSALDALRSQVAGS